ncbi:MAG TPA: hypothetical protein VMV94_03250 [Phycisphaerae bacterium]|nr:hypothetical protein [Phycisphaerae bacterium]
MLPTGRWRQIVLLAGTVAVLAAAVGVWHRRGTSAFSADRHSWNAVLQCLNCGHRFEAELKLTFPLSAQTCPQCGKPAAWQVKLCSQCNHSFVPELSGDPPRPPIVPKCPKCGSDRHVGALLPGSGQGKVGS